MLVAGCIFVPYVSVGVTWAGYEEGYRAWKDHEFGSAFTELLPLVEQGHVKAQVLVGGGGSRPPEC